jgi:hypothetical protein
MPIATSITRLPFKIFVKGALEATIRLHTNKSTTVYYEIDGEIVREWDA